MVVSIVSKAQPRAPSCKSSRCQAPPKPHAALHYAAVLAAELATKLAAVLTAVLYAAVPLAYCLQASLLPFAESYFA